MKLAAALLLLAATPATAQITPPTGPLRVPPAGSMRLPDDVIAKAQIDRLEAQVAQLQKDMAAMKAQLADAAKANDATDGKVAVLRKEFDTHDHIWMHPEQSATTTYYTPELTTVRRKFCHIEPANKNSNSTSKKAVCSVAASDD